MPRNRILQPSVLPGNTFLHKILLTLEWQSFDLWGFGLHGAPGEVSWPVGGVGQGAEGFVGVGSQVGKGLCEGMG